MDSTTDTKKRSDLLFILWAGGAALLSYALVYALRKPFTAAGFDGLEFLGMDYKTAASIIQIAGYVLSKLLGIKFISELKHECRLRFIIGSVAAAECSLLLFAVLPRPFNILALFFNGLSLGCMWGVIFSFLEGRRLSGILASIMGLSIAFSSGLAKSLGLFLTNDLGISEFWMPAAIGAGAFPLLILLAFALDRLPAPTAEDIASCTERIPMDARQRRNVFLRIAPILCMLLLANLFITTMQDIKEDFLVKLVDTSALSSWAFSGIDSAVTLIILGTFLLLSLIRSHRTVLVALLLLVTAGTAALAGVAYGYDRLQLPPLLWLFIQSLGLYTAYLSFQTLFFERFVSCFGIRGNVGFFIITIDFAGYLGTVCMLVFKEVFAAGLDWIEFYNTMVAALGCACCLLFVGSLLWLVRRERTGIRRTGRRRRPYAVVSVNMQ